MNVTKPIHEMLAKVASLRQLSVDEAVTYAITEGAVDARGERIPIKQVADLMNMPLSVVYDIASGRRPARLREAALIVRATNVFAPVDVAEHQLGRVGVRLPVGDPSADPSTSKAATLCRNFGELMAQYGSAGEDRRYTRSEAAAIKAEAADLHAAIAEFVSQVEVQAVPDAPTLKAVGK